MKIIAHRGSSKIFKENTLDAFRESVNSGVKILELDVCICRNKHLVVSHENVDKKTGVPISDTVQNTHLKLETFLKAFSCLDVEFIFDVKEFTSSVLIIQLLMEKLNCYGVCHKSIIASFNESHLEFLRDYRLPGLKIALISERIECDFFKKLVEKTEIDFLIVPVSHTTRELVEKCSVPVLAYTCNTIGMFEYCRNIGTQGVFSDCPEDFVQIT